jgi:hypothetical protein
VCEYVPASVKEKLAVESALPPTWVAPPESHGACPGAGLHEDVVVVSVGRDRLLDS